MSVDAIDMNKYELNLRIGIAILVSSNGKENHLWIGATQFGNLFGQITIIWYADSGWKRRAAH